MASTIRTISFNVNGIRARLHQLEKVLNEHQPDVLGLQEIKVCDEDFPEEAVTDMGYKVDFFGQKGHYGVALLSKIDAIKVIRGYPTDDHDAQRRMIHGEYRFNGSAVHVINGYFPQGENRKHTTKFPAKEKYYADLVKYVRNTFSTDDNVIVMGDMNVAAEDADVGLTPENAKRWLQRGVCCFLPEEREWLKSLMECGLTDTFRHMNSADDTSYSWFDYRSRGFDQNPKRGLRIDLILSSAALTKRLVSTGIDFEARASEKPSDHCPIWADFDLQ
jgi:exodeoxyribonuclease-3